MCSTQEVLQGSRFEKMQAASSALAAKFKEEPRLLVPSTLILLDQDVDENDPMFGIVEALVMAEWPTLRNTHVSRPRELLRSIIIDALAIGADNNPEVSGVIWNSSAALIRHKQARLGKAQHVIEKVLRSAMEIAESEAAAGVEFVGPKTGPKRKQQSSSDWSIKPDEVIAGIASAAGPQYPAGQALENSNPHWPNPDGNWSTEFTPRMAKVMSDAVNLGGSRIAKSVSKTVEPSRTRLDVLWWSYALYSPLLDRGYRDLSLPSAALAAAVDLAKIVPIHAPASVCYVLGETVRRISQDAASNDEMPLHSFLKDIADTNLGFGDGLPADLSTESRRPLVDLVSEAASGSRIGEADIHARTGVEAKLKLSPAEFAMWVFRGLQANRIVESIG